TLVTQALAGLAPWTSHLTRLPGASLWKSHFADKAPSEMVEREQVHALVDPQCAGLAQLICDYNDYLGVTSTKRLDPPEAQLGVPRSLATDAASSGASPPAPDRFQPPALSEDDLARLEFTLSRRRERRQRLRPGWLSVSVGG